MLDNFSHEELKLEACKFAALLWAIEQVVLMDDIALTDLAGILGMEQEEVMDIFNIAVEIFNEQDIV